MQLMNCVVNHTVDRLSVERLQRIANLHAPGGLKIRNHNRQSLSIGRQFNVSKIEYLFVIVFGPIICCPFQRPGFDLNT